MDYAEFPAPTALRHLAKLAWTLDVPGPANDRLAHVATPDGCMEIIRRLRGKSDWNGEQPEAFVAGIITRPATLHLAGGSRFVGLRIWPWAWHALTGRSPGALIDGWADLAALLPEFELPPVAVDAFGSLDAVTLHPRSMRIATAVMDSRSVREIAERAGIAPRALQRWFGVHVGVPPRSYLRLLRFSEAFAELAESGASLAAHAVDHGFADQSHMAREFRSLAGSPARAAKLRARGPFIQEPRD